MEAVDINNTFGMCSNATTWLLLALIDHVGVMLIGALVTMVAYGIAMLQARFYSGFMMLC